MRHPGESGVAVADMTAPECNTMNDPIPITFSRHGPEGTGLMELEGIPAEALVSGAPVLSGYNYFHGEEDFLHLPAQVVSQREASPLCP